MAEIISMPQLSDTMREGIIIKWNKKVGDIVSEGDILAEIETDKAIQDFEIDVNGVLLFIGVKEGEKTKVNDILAIIGEKNENIDHMISELIKKKDKKKNIKHFEKNQESDHFSYKKRKFISPLAKKIAKKSGIPIENIKKGSGPMGRIIKKDIEVYKKEKLEKRIVPSSIRRKIAKHLTSSKFSAPHYYLFSEINVDKLISLRKNLNDQLSKKEKISFNDIIIKAVALSLKKDKEINVSWKEDEVIMHNSINIGFAVSVQDGLIVPVIKNVDQKSISQISKETKDKIDRSKYGKIKLEEIENSTFTISNLGMYGIDFFTSIINIPNSSILSIGSITERPIITNAQICIGNIMKITLSCDHRIIDGALASSFIHSIKNFLENPFTILL
ncbi:dihydrolipoamide acetyltransferase family protein [Blattabacterium cuenoti]|uniref:dihydrolipoamide acetyltransferase family protein n=1 Tax=Blattabacterium cuenoti TaxID=1653831 RepID=UPI00163C0155|nr:dihydrolipoamide acetyltransferase family protein [Blattabacterium cuenoti]